MPKRPNKYYEHIKRIRGLIGVYDADITTIQKSGVWLSAQRTIFDCLIDD